MFRCCRIWEPHKIQSVPDVVDCNSIHGTSDKVDVNILEGLAPAVLKLCWRYPVEIYGDGNWLYRAISFGLFKTQSHHLHLRLITALEISRNRKQYDVNHKDYRGRLVDNRVIVNSYPHLIHEALRVTVCSEMQHMYALSEAIRMPIRSYYSPQIVRGFHSEPFHRKIVGHTANMSEEPAVTVMWTSQEAPLSAEDFHPIHIVPLMRKTPGWQENVWCVRWEQIISVACRKSEKVLKHQSRIPPLVHVCYPIMV